MCDHVVASCSKSVVSINAYAHQRKKRKAKQSKHTIASKVTQLDEFKTYRNPPNGPTHHFPAPAANHLVLRIRLSSPYCLSAIDTGGRSHGFVSPTPPQTLLASIARADGMMEDLHEAEVENGTIDQLRGNWVVVGVGFLQLMECVVCEEGGFGDGVAHDLVEGSGGSELRHEACEDGVRPGAVAM